MSPRNAASAVLPGLLSAGFIAAAAATPVAPSLAAGLASIRLTPEREVIRADGKSATVIIAEVRDERGNVVPDGTRIRFATTAGRLDTTVVGTQNGVARVLLTASDIPTSALVTANLETPGLAAPAQRTIIFSLDAEEEQSNWMRIEGDTYIGYAAVSGIIQANGKDGGARIFFRNITVSADALQLNVADNSLVAVGNVQLTRGDVKQTYSSLRFQLMQAQGIGATEDAEQGRRSLFTVRGPRLEQTPLTPVVGNPEHEAALADLSTETIMVVARSLALEPGRWLQFRRATFYIDGVKTVSLPYHVMALGQDSLFQEQIVGYGPTGLTVDFPLYYDVRPSGVGTFHIRRAPRVGSSAYATRPGWSLDLEQGYNAAGKLDGTFELTGMTRKDWGARLRHGQRFDGATRANLFVDFPNHRDLFANTQLSRQFRGFTLNGMASGSRSTTVDPVSGERASGGDLRGQLFAETNPHALLGIAPLRYTLNVSTARQSFYGPNALAQGIVQTQTANVRLFTNPLPLGRQTSLTQTLSLGKTWVGGGANQFGLRDGPSILGTTSLNRLLTGLGSAQITYDYAQTPQFGSSTIFTGRHRLSLNTFLTKGTAWNLSLAASQGLDSPQSSLFGTLDFSLGGPWRGRAALSASRAGAFRYRDIEYALVRRIAGRDVALYYSTTSKRFQLDLSGARF